MSEELNQNIPVKRIMICCNGFINTKNHACLEFSDYFHSINKNLDMEVITIDLYDPRDPKTYKRKLQRKVLIDEVSKWADKNYIIYLLGYSYSAGICAHVSTLFPQVRKLILISPTLYLLKTRLLVSYLKTAAKYLKIRFRHPRKSKSAMNRMRTKGIIRLSYNVARSIFSERKYFKKVRCKVFVGKAINDSFCIGKTLWKITHSLELNRVTLKSYPQGGHNMIMHLDSGKECFDDILLFAFHFKNPEDNIEENEEKLSTLSFRIINDKSEN